MTSSSLRRPQRGRCRRWRLTIASRSGSLPKGPQSALPRAGLPLPPALRFLPTAALPLPNPFAAVALVRWWGWLLVVMSCLVEGSSKVEENMGIRVSPQLGGVPAVTPASEWYVHEGERQSNTMALFTSAKMERQTESSNRHSNSSRMHNQSTQTR